MYCNKLVLLFYQCMLQEILLCKGYQDCSSAVENWSVSLSHCVLQRCHTLPFGSYGSPRRV